MADALQQQNPPRPLDRENGDSELWRIHREVAALAARLQRASRSYRAACGLPPDAPPRDHHTAAKRRQEH